MRIPARVHLLGVKPNTGRAEEILTRLAGTIRHFYDSCARDADNGEVAVVRRFQKGDGHRLTYRRRGTQEEVFVEIADERLTTAEHEEKKPEPEGIYDTALIEFQIEDVSKEFADGNTRDRSMNFVAYIPPDPPFVGEDYLRFTSVLSFAGGSSPIFGEPYLKFPRFDMTRVEAGPFDPGTVFRASLKVNLIPYHSRCAGVFPAR